MLLAELGEPIMSSSLLLPGETQSMTDPAEIKERLDHMVDLVIEGGNGGVEPSSVVDLTSGAPVDHAPRQGRRLGVRMNGDPTGLRIIAPFRWVLGRSCFV